LGDRQVVNLRYTCELVCHSAGFWENEKKPGGLGRYGVKYATKSFQKDVPFYFSLVGRFWGASRSFACPEGIDFQATDDDVRGLVEAWGRDFSRWQVLPKIIFVSESVTRNLYERFV
jgi:hypothetical protein